MVEVDVVSITCKFEWLPSGTFYTCTVTMNNLFKFILFYIFE